MAKLGVPLAGTFTLLLWRYALVLAVVALIVTWPANGGALRRHLPDRFLGAFRLACRDS